MVSVFNARKACQLPCCLEHENAQVVKLLPCSPLLLHVPQVMTWHMAQPLKSEVHAANEGRLIMQQIKSCNSWQALSLTHSKWVQQ